MSKNSDTISEMKVLNTDSYDDSSLDKTNALEDTETETNFQSMEDLMQFYEESLKNFQEGEVITGEIVQLDREYVLVDIGYKSEGRISISEFTNADKKVEVKLGDQVDVLLEQKEDDNGHIILSKEKAARIKLWDKIKVVYEENGTIQGKIISRVRGGLSVDIGPQAFLPGSQVDLRPIRDLDALIGTEHDFKIVKYDKRQGNIVLSRRALLKEKRDTQREETLKNLVEGAIMEGTVTNITNYGLFIDLGGIDGLVHITDLSWGRVGHPSESYQTGDRISVKVLNFDKENERVSLGIKQLTPDPWSEAANKFPVGTKITGRVVSLTDYGAFLEVQEGVEGLIHVSEMSWTRKIRHPTQVLKVGDKVDAIVLNIDATKRRISLGMKQVEPNPWDSIDDKYPAGTIIEGSIKNITSFGIFIGIDEGIDGLVHISDISWTKRIKHPSELYKKGQTIQAIILNIDKANERFSLGIKQLTTNPWDNISKKYSRGMKITGTIASITDFGIFIELEEGVKGLVQNAELPKDNSSTSQYKVGDKITAMVINVSKDDNKIDLSLQRLHESKEKAIFRNYIDNREEATSNLGDLLKEEMLNLQQTSEEGYEKEDSKKDEDTDNCT